MRTLYSHPDGSRCRVQRTSDPYPYPGRRVSLRAVRRASMTVEAAWALPLFFLTVVCLICMMELYGNYAAQVVRLQEQAETAGAYVSLAGEYAPEIVDLPVPIVYQPRWAPSVLPGVKLAARGRVHTWSGRSADEAAPAEDDWEEMVYVAEYASVYHTRSDCTHLALSVRAVGAGQVDRLRNTAGAKYHACDKCVGSGGKNATVYITEEGTHFHNSAECSGLTRTVRLVRQSEVGGLHMCSRCQAAAAAA